MEGPCTDEEQAGDQKLQHLLKNLEHEWDFIKKRPEKILYRTSTGSSTKMIKTLGSLNQNSPRELIMSPPLDEVAWKVRTNDLAVEEILRERRAAIESGKLKGRRLFEDDEDVNEVSFGRNEGSCSGFEIGLVQESEVRSVFSYESDNYEDENWPGKEHMSPSYPHCSSSSSSLCGAETLQRGSGTEMATMAEKKIGSDVGSGKVRLIVIKIWVAISLVVFIVGIISTSSFGIYEDEEVILTPT
ncbi:hypothetical protein ES319_A12G199900v1 [Gossypium barbadense]|uniref:Uncharacterized protein n=2 Tax=Gossypium TaxID=3633 RepID=A0A2P5WGA4_GOSBA|nr:hypothetical protein ES319_A12G199900v1 [Gossypium barbadense]PPR90124.1 hypothetical protein GOBAR_AA30567 [Gossypium barbadense]TYG90878.1 hypothetical protein ES288_A12G218100v1 [Gossypium darwinii]